MHLASVWRYPIKSMRGEPLNEAELTDDGVAGDRTVHVAGERGVVTGRTRHDLLTLSVRTAPDGTPLLEGVSLELAASTEKPVPHRRSRTAARRLRRT